MNGNDYDHTRKLPRLSVKDVFSTEKIRLVTISAGRKGTRLYVDGLLIGADQSWQLVVPKQGKKLRLVVGNSVTGRQSWIGEIHGLALYGKSLSPEKVEHHFDGWTHEGRFPIDTMEDPLVLYSFAGRQGNQVQEQSSLNHALQIPLRPIVLEKVFLSPPWHDFKADRSFFVDAALNFIGFIPLGAVLFGWLKTSPSGFGLHVNLTIVAFCFLLSLGMELLQAWMPTRSSSFLDLTLNTLGAWLGMYLFERTMKIKWIC
jgi:VanZ family protein